MQRSMSIDTSTNETEYSAVDFAESLKASFIGSDKPADERYAPRILTNDKSLGTDVLSVLKRELVDCISFDFSVAFVTAGGIQILIDILRMLAARNIPGRILVSTYLNFNDPSALVKLLEYPNIEVRVYQGEMHAKGYFFNKEQLSTIVIGSSNLTQKALTCNKEWNVLFRSFDGGEMLEQVRKEFEVLWTAENTVKLSKLWIDEYRLFLASETQAEEMPQKSKTAFVASNETSRLGLLKQEEITPNNMQSQALEALAVLHARNEDRALLVSATGTGKTYLSALDVRTCNPKRVLFVAHRKRILSASLQSFNRVLGPRYTYGIYGESSYSPDTTCVFAMVTSLSKHREEFDSNTFDYIIIDEAHRTGAASYQRILSYFNPKFFLGMTATPSRTDGYDVYSLFNHVIAYRITLQDALNSEMLAPFHYFGIADLSIDEDDLDDLTLFSKLTSDERVRHIASRIEEYSVEKESRRGLIFCSWNEEAAELSDKLNKVGYRTQAISGATSEEDRNRAIARLESGELEYLLSVDILNEGIDIPSLNQIIMLRRTDSTIVFTQQLGRGLRKHSGKEYTLVLDFIGNYQSNFLIPMALSGDRTYNKDTLRKVVKEGSTVIPGCSTISFDEISEKRIFKALEEGRFSDAKLIRSEYENLKQILGRIPSLVDFDKNEAIDPMIIINKYGSYAAFLQKYEKAYSSRLNERQLAALKFLSTKLASGKRREDLLVLRELIRGKSFQTNSYTPKNAAAAEIASVARVLSGEYSKAGEKLAVYENGVFMLSQWFADALANDAFRSAVIDAIEFGCHRNAKLFSQSYKDTDFVLYEKYSREEICRLLRWGKEPNFQNVGGYFHDKQTNTFPVFVNYEKDPTISITTQYEDRFISENRLIAISKSNRTLQSPEIRMLSNSRENGVRCYLFMRKNKDDADQGTEFYFLGEINPTGEFEQIILADGKTSAVEIVYELETPVRADLYDYLTTNLDD